MADVKNATQLKIEIAIKLGVQNIPVLDRSPEYHSTRMKFEHCCDLAEIMVEEMTIKGWVEREI